MAEAKQRGKAVPFYRSIQAKYALTYLLVVAAILIVLNTYPVLMAENMVFTSKESTLKRQALVIGSTLAVSENLTRESVEQTMALLEEAQGTRVLVTDASGLPVPHLQFQRLILLRVGVCQHMQAQHAVR